MRDVIIRLSGHLIAGARSPKRTRCPGRWSSSPTNCSRRKSSRSASAKWRASSRRPAAGPATPRSWPAAAAIPAVSGVPGILQARQERRHRSSSTAAKGTCSSIPTPKRPAAYRKLQREFFDLKDALAENRDQPAVTADGDTGRAAGQHQQPGRRQGRRARWARRASGCFAPSTCSSRIPTCPTKRSSSRPIARSSPPVPNRQVTIRTLDLGGDKTIPYLGHDREANPFMGWRSIRLSFEHPEFFSTQIRAICGPRSSDAGATKRVRLMFPMITTLEEMRRVRGHGAAGRRGNSNAEGQAVRPSADRLDARSAGGGRVDRHAAGRGRFRFDRLERPGAVSDGGRSRQSQGQPSVPAAQPAGAAGAGRHDHAPAARPASR